MQATQETHAAVLRGAAMAQCPPTIPSQRVVLLSEIRKPASRKSLACMHERKQRDQTSLKAVPLRELVRKLVRLPSPSPGVKEVRLKAGHQNPDPNQTFRRAFLLNHTSFMSSNALISWLLEVYDRPIPQRTPESEAPQGELVCQIFIDWIDLVYVHWHKTGLWERVDKHIEAAIENEPSQKRKGLRRGHRRIVKLHIRKHRADYKASPSIKKLNKEKARLWKAVMQQLRDGTGQSDANKKAKGTKRGSMTFVPDKAAGVKPSASALSGSPAMGLHPRHSVCLGYSLDVCAYRASLLAQDITQSDWNDFACVRPIEFIRKNWTRKDTAHMDSPNVVALVNAFNKRSFWVASEILSRQDPSDRVHALKKFVNCAAELGALRNYFGAYAVLNGLSLTPVHRLKATWARMPGKSKERFKAVNTALDKSQNYRAYHKLLKEGMIQKLPQVPHLASLLNDLYQLEQIKAPTPPCKCAPTKCHCAAGDHDAPVLSDQDLAKVIPFHKYMKQWSVLHDLMTCRAKPYSSFGTDSRVAAALFVSSSHICTEDQLFELSYRAEPKI